MKRISRQCAALLMAGSLLGGCSPIPQRELPVVPQAASYKEAQGHWLKVDPAYPGIQPDWWKVFKIPELNALEVQAAANNQDVAQAFARLQQARATAHIDASHLFPQVNMEIGPNRYETSQTAAGFAPHFYNNIVAQGEATYETDLWGRVRAQVVADKKNAEASADDVAAARLTIEAELARDYFTLRGFDELGRLLAQTVANYQKAYDVNKEGFKGGIATEADVTEAETQLYDAKTRAADNRLHREQTEHAIAVLIGESPSLFGLKQKKLPAFVPAPPNPGVPAMLLVRRPDVAAAARQVEAANAEIGVARAAFFPDLTLNASAGYQSRALPLLVSAPSLIWTIGADLLTPIFEGGRLEAQVKQAHGKYAETAARYRGTVLAAVQSAEDALTATKELEIEGRTQATATAAAEKTLELITDRYKGGESTYLDVVVAQNTALQAEIGSINVHTQRLLTDTDLIRALGGGWTGQQTPVAKPAPPRT
jgi:NodT family efflux transporter outer membrane factor (OMF) lipoprotein